MSETPATPEIIVCQLVLSPEIFAIISSAIERLYPALMIVEMPIFAHTQGELDAGIKSYMIAAR